MKNTNDLEFHKVNSSSKKDINNLFDIVNTNFSYCLKTIYPKEIFNYLFYFLDENSLKNKIEFDNHIFYLILKEKEITGYFNYRYFNNTLLICDIFLKEEFRNKGISNSILDFLKQKAKEKKLTKLQTFVYKKNRAAKTFYTKSGFKKINTQANYIGSDIYLFEDVFEYIL